MGGQYIKEAKTYQKKLGQFTDSLDPRPDPVPSVTPGHENVAGELDVVNRQYLELLAQVLQHAQVLKAVHEREGVYFPVSFQVQGFFRMFLFQTIQGFSSVGGVGCPFSWISMS